MKFGKLDIPEELLESQLKKNLVIFAGAGVSMAEPCGLPSFDGLAKEIEKQTHISKMNHERIDQYLGRVEEQYKISIRELIQRILSPKDAKFNAIHSSVVRLFSSEKDIKIVTTNFDNFFELTLNDQNKSPELFYAPALPNGDNFNGVVYLHGSLSKSFNRIVATDADFGRGYLTEGWARRFLRQLFSKYDVLFIGYSHNDDVFNYLTRGLPPQTNTKRYILTDSNDQEKWSSFKISPIIYEKVSPNDHHAMVLGLKEWADHSSKEVLEHAERIRDIVSSKPQISDRDDDYLIKFVFKNEVVLDYFVQYATFIEWLFWCNEKSFLTFLFKKGELSNSEKKLVFWICNKFLLKYPYEVLLLISQKHQNINQEFAYEIVRSLLTVKESSSDRHMKDLLQLVLNQDYEVSSDLMSMLLQRFHSQRDTALILFKYLIFPKLEFENREKYGAVIDLKQEEKISYDISVRGEAYWLQEFESKVIVKEKVFYYPRLLKVFISYIEHIYNYYNTYDGSNWEFDPVSLKRSAVERHNQNSSYNDGVQLFFDVFADSLLWTAKNDTLATSFYLDEFSKSSLPYFLRSSILLCREAKHMSADEKIQFLLDCELIFNSECHHEVFSFFEKVFPLSSNESKDQAVRAIIKYCPKRRIENEHVLNDERYRMLSLLKWIYKSDPGYEDLNLKIKELTSDEEENEISEYADFKSYHSGVVDVEYETELTIERLLDLDLNVELNFILDFKDKNNIGRYSNRGAMSLVQDTVKKSPEWGVRFANALINQNEWTTDAWRYLLRGLGEGNLRNEDWSDILKLLEGNVTNLASYLAEVCDFLEKGLRNKENQIHPNLFQLCTNITKTIWECAKDLPLDKDIDDWFGAAINRVGGKLAEIWMEIVSLQRSRDKNYNCSEYLILWKKVIDHGSSQSLMASCIFCGQLYFLYSVDSSWAKINLLPLFKFSKMGRNAKAAWDGYLHVGRWSQDMLDDLLEVFQNTFDHLDELGGSRKHFVEFVAGISMTGDFNPLNEDWLPKFVNIASQEDLKNFTRDIDRLFEHRKGNSEIIAKAWERWVKRYWENRLKGIPRAFYDSEIYYLPSWVVHIEENISEAVEMLRKTDCSKMKRLSCIYEVNEKKLCEKFPCEVFSIIFHIVSQVSYNQIDFYSLTPIVRQLIVNSKIEKELRLKLAHRLAAIGCQEAQEILGLISE